MIAPFGIRPKGTLQARMLPLAQALVQKGHGVHIIAPAIHNPEDAGTQVVYDGVMVRHTALPRIPYPFAAMSHVALLVQGALRIQPHVLHIFKPKGFSGLAALALRVVRPSIPVVVDTDDWEGWGGWNDLLPYPYPAKLLFAWQEHHLPRYADAVTVASRTLETQVWGFGVQPQRVFHLPNGVLNMAHGQELSNLHRVSMNGSSSAESPITLLLYTRFWEFDITYFIQALVAVAIRYPHVKLIIVGRGENGEENHLLQQAARAGIAGMIDYRGWAEPHAIPAILASADIALCPLNDTLINRARGLAKLLELMAIGLPVVAGRVGEAAEYIQHRQSGLLVEPNDSAAFARAIFQLIESPTLRVQLGAGAQARVREMFTWNRLAARAEQAYAFARHHRAPS